jgi:hypothetical protein
MIDTDDHGGHSVPRERAMRPHFTGKEVEAEVLGTARVKWDGKFVPFMKSVKLAATSQPTQVTPFAQKLHALVAKQLGVAPTDVRYYTAVDSPLDFYHGVDCWFEFKGKAVTVDVTIDPAKLEGKADVILNVSDEAFALQHGPQWIKRQFAAKGAA